MFYTSILHRLRANKESFMEFILHILVPVVIYCVSSVIRGLRESIEPLIDSILGYFFPNGNHTLDRELLIAVKENNFVKVKDLLTRGADVNKKDGCGFTPLHFASIYGHKDLVMFLLNNGADIEAKDSKNYTPLHWASKNGHAEVVKSLLNKGANIKARDKEEQTPLHLASCEGHMKVVELLLNKGANIEAQNGIGETPLCSASYYGHVEVVKLLLSKNADIKTENVFGETPLRAASEGGHTKIVELLFAKSVDMRATDLSDKNFVDSGEQATKNTKIMQDSNLSFQERIARSTSNSLSKSISQGS